MTAPHTTYLQGSFRATAAATIRVTDDPLGAPTTSDWVVALGETWNSLDEMLVTWNAQLAADIGSTFTVVTRGSGGGAIKLQVGTGGNNFSIDWSQTGDGTDLRDWVGETGDVTNQANGYLFTDTVPAAFYPTYAARVARRTASRRHRATSIALDGSVTSQGHAATSDADVVDMGITLWFGEANTYLEHQQLETFVDAVFDEDGGGEPWSIFDNGDQWVCRWTDSPLVLVPERVDGAESGQKIWELSMSAVAEVAAW